MRRGLPIGLGLVLVLGAVNAFIAQKERVVAHGAVVLLELAPVDPRSLIQGDYMRLDYAIAREARPDSTWPRTGRIVVQLDTNGVARFTRRDDGVAPRAGQHLLLYRLRGSRLRLGSDAFFFQEGEAARYATAKYGELRVARDGSSVLVGLRDAELRPLR